MTLLAKWLRKASSLFSEKTEAKVDDFGLEHILLYHGLAGSSPDNQRQYKDVRADLLSAIGRKNSQNLCINLKIPPLWWEEKLQRIFADAKNDAAEATVNTLLPAVHTAQEGSEFDPLMYSDWRVQANAAIILAYLQITESQERMITALNDTAGSASPAHCHIARSLAEFRTDLAKEALSKHINQAEPWIRVDAVNALARWPLAEISPLMLKAFAEYHDFTDYASVALARQHQPVEFFQADGASGTDDTDGAEMADLGATILLGVMEAAGASFSSNTDLLSELSVQQCLAPLLQATEKHCSPARLRALLQLSDWLDKNYHQYRLEADGYPEQEQIAAAKSACTALIKQLDINQTIKDGLDKNAEKNVRRTDIRHAIKLAGELRLAYTVPLLLELLTEQAAYRDDVIEALGLIGEGDSAPALIKLAKTIVNMENRTQGTLSVNPIEESDVKNASTYWSILRALGNLPGEETPAFLLQATNDEAPDKREEALSSLLRLWIKSEGKISRASEIKEAVQKCLADPSPSVRIKAMESAAALNLADRIPALVALINAQEMSVNRAAFSALEKLAARGHKDEIRTALTGAKQGQSNSVKVKRIDEFIQHHL